MAQTQQNHRIDYNDSYLKIGGNGFGLSSKGVSYTKFGRDHPFFGQNYRQGIVFVLSDNLDTRAIVGQLEAAIPAYLKDKVKVNPCEISVGKLELMATNEVELIRSNREF